MYATLIFRGARRPVRPVRVGKRRDCLSHYENNLEDPQMEDIIKSVRLGTIDFFGILIPGLLAVVIFGVGFFIPLLLLILDITGPVSLFQGEPEPSVVVFILFVLTVLAYVLGYVLRLSSPDELDRVSGEYVTKRERKLNKSFKEEWPYDYEDPLDKYPYFNFRTYLIKRGHTHLTRDLVTWGPDDQVGLPWLDENGRKPSVLVTKRSKTTVNKMKLDIRLYCPQLTGLLESKEGHIRLMAGTWAAFRFSLLPACLAWLIVTPVALLFQWPGWYSSVWTPQQDYFVLSFVIFAVCLVVFFSRRRIQQLFHYRRVNELFHIVQAAYLAQEEKKKKAKEVERRNSPSNHRETV